MNKTVGNLLSLSTDWNVRTWETLSVMVKWWQLCTSCKHIHTSLPPPFSFRPRIKPFVWRLSWIGQLKNIIFLQYLKMDYLCSETLKEQRQKQMWARIWLCYSKMYLSDAITELSVVVWYGLKIVQKIVLVLGVGEGFKYFRDIKDVSLGWMCYLEQLPKL